ncbi:MAG: Trm112 family protein [Pseudaminobacter sp.]
MTREKNAPLIDVKLLELLACPLTKGPLVWDENRQELVSRLARLAYPVRDGIPVMLPSEARTIELDDDEKK